MAVKKETPSKNLLDTIPGKINWIWPVIKSRHNYIRPPEKAEELRLAYEAAEKANHAKSVFLANMSHEMRTPLNAILGITEIQLQNKTITPELREALNKIYNSGDLLLGIINDILDLSKIEAGKFELSEAPYQVASLIHDSAALNMMHCKDKPIQFKLSIDKDIPAVLAGDELRIKEILNNLLSNAFKYTRKGAITLSVSVQAETNDGDNTVDGREAARDREADKNSFITLVFSVSDTGLGMTEDQIGKLYDEYTRFN
ncbi:MAG: ATP-binding protein, partial [Treponema sp.]|nr:ATP-binding protein [Treponema sp.]